MRKIVEMRTDICALAAGDPTLLQSLRETQGTNYLALMDEAVADGRLWRIDTEEDGEFLFHVFLEEEPPSDLAQHLVELIDVERFHVPSGRLLIAGEECFIGAVDLADVPHMGQEITIPIGDYRLTVLRADLPDGLLKERFQAVATRDERAAWSMGLRLPWLGVITTIAMLTASCLGYPRWLSGVAALIPFAITATVWVAIVLFWKGARFHAARARFHALAREMPSFALVLRSLPS